ncbi:MAG: hypothetical protein LQ342_002818 [Letrouitia transgressa]|nr:MAG: hypothetical protein LQ342_002818 [Letrouitia transgressa]
MLDLLQHIKDSNVTFKGDLEFVNDWQYFSLYPLVEHDQLTTTGPYAGSLSAFVAGTRLRSRYLHLLDAPSKPNKTSFWASDCNRVIETARYFAIGFFGLDWSPKAKLHVVPETPNLGGNTLTPGDTCAMYRSDLEEGHDYGLKQLIKFRSTYLPAVSARFYAQNDGLRFSDGEIYSMQEMCGFETLVRGSSPWCEAFTQEDWLNFEYARDVIHYYRAGPGNPYGAAMGWLWLNATTNLLVRGPSVGQIFFSFVHDGDIVPMLAALNLLPSTHHLPVTHREASRSWKLSQVVPMNGRIIFERLHCDGSALPATAKRQAQPKGPRQTPPEKADPYKSSFVRININDGVVALPGCANGPGSSCAVEDFAAFVRKRGEEIGGFRETCGLGRNASARITFLHQ